MRKVSKLFLALVMVLSLTCTTAWAGETEPEVVAQIGTATYTSLADAVTEASITDTITLMSDVVLTDTLTINDGETVNLDLNGYTISRANAVINVLHGSLNVTGTGTIQETANDGFAPILVKGSNNAEDTNYTNISIGENVTLRGWSGIFIDKNADNLACGVEVNLNGTIYTPAQDDHTTEGYGIYVNGKIQNTTNYPVINIGTTAKIIARLGVGIYAAGYAEWNIANGSSITGFDSGIAIKAGKLNITGGTVSCTGPDTAPTTGFSNGVNASGAAIQIESNNSYAGNIDVSISGGTITSSNGYSIYEYLANGTTVSKVIDFDISGGSFNGKMMISKELADAEGSPSVTGGAFPYNPIDYVAKGYAVTRSGADYVVNAATTVAAVEVTTNATTTNVTKVEVASATTVTIDVSSTGKDNVTMDNSVISTVFGANKPVEIKTEDVGIVFDTAAAGIIDNAVTREDVTLTMDKTVRGKTVTLTITAQAGSDKLLTNSAASGSMIITIDVSDLYKDGTIVNIVHKDASGKVKGTYSAKVVGGKVSFTNPHGLSSFTLSRATTISYASPVVTTTVQSPKTADAGVVLYAVSSVLSLTGMCYLGKKKTNI